MAIHVEFLKSIPYFAGLSLAELESIRSLIFEKAVDKGEMVLFEEEPAQVLYFVASGVVKVFKTSAEGKEQILNIVLPGGSFNEVPLFDGGLNLASAQAMAPAVLYGINISDLEAIIGKYPQVALNANRVLSQRIRDMVSLVEDLSFRHVTGRVARILLEYAGDGTDPRPRLTQQEMASMAGTAREMIGRSLKVLEDEGAIRLDRHRLLITDKETLREIAGVVD